MEFAFHLTNFHCAFKIAVSRERVCYLFVFCCWSSMIRFSLNLIKWWNVFFFLSITSYIAIESQNFAATEFLIAEGIARIPPWICRGYLCVCALIFKCGYVFVFALNFRAVHFHIYSIWFGRVKNKWNEYEYTTSQEVDGWVCNVYVRMAAGDSHLNRRSKTEYTCLARTHTTHIRWCGEKSCDSAVSNGNGRKSSKNLKNLCVWRGKPRMQWQLTVSVWCHHIRYTT